MRQRSARGQSVCSVHADSACDSQHTDLPLLEMPLLDLQPLELPPLELLPLELLQLVLLPLELPSGAAIPEASAALLPLELLRS